MHNDDDTGATYLEIPGRIPEKIKYRAGGERKSVERDGPVPMSEIQEVPLKYLWPPYIPVGRLTMLGGDPGSGKTFITMALAAALSRGERLPGMEEDLEVGNTLLLSVEDDPADTMKPRLRNLRADMRKIFISEDDIVLDSDGLNSIRTMIKQTNAKLVIIDPIVAFLGPNMDMNRANEVRHIMKAVKRIAAEFGIAIVIVRHNRKEGTNGSTGKAIYNGMGSIDFIASVRSELAVVTSPNGTHFLNHIKVNTGPLGPSIIYKITNQDDDTGLFEWGEFAKWPPAKGKSENKISVTFKDEEKVKAWLFDLLKNYPDGLPSTDVFSMGKLAGHSDTKIKKAKEGVARAEKRKTGWVWVLGTDPKVEVDEDGVVQ